jgi:hypothetical protein
MDEEEIFSNEIFDNFGELQKSLILTNNLLSIKCIHVNIRSCRINWDSFFIDLVGSKIDWDLIAVSETNLNENEVNYYNIENYERLNICRENKRGGGILLFIKNNKFESVTCKKIRISEDDALDVTLSLAKEVYNVIVTYRTPSASRIKYIKELKELLKEKDNHKESNKIIMGDFNFNILKNMQDKSEKHDIEKFENLIASHGYNQQIDSETRVELRLNKVTRSCLDLIFTKLKDNCCKGYVIKMKPADHYYTAVEIWNNNSFETSSATKNQFSYKLNNVNIEKQLKNINWDFLKNYKDPNEMYKKIEETITDIYKNNRVVKRLKKTNNTMRNEWMNRSLQEKINQKNKLWSVISKLQPPTEEMINEYNNLKKVVKREVFQTKQEFYETFFSKNVKDSAKVWDKLNKLTSKNNAQKTRNIDTCINEAFKNEDSKILGEKFNKSFLSQVPNLQRTNQITKSKKLLNTKKLKNTTASNPSSMLVLKPTAYDVTIILSKLKGKKSTGYDGFLLEHFINTSLNTGIFMSKLICSIIDTEIWPDNLKKQVLRPVYKKGDKKDCNNYRPIALLPVLNKIVEKFFAEQIEKFFKKFQLMNKQQYGYQKGIGTVDALHYINNNITRALNEGKFVGAILIDLQKAFDTLNKEILTEKLYKQGIRGKMLAILISYLTSRKCCVRINNENSDWSEVLHGVPQGSILGPLLFLIYVNDIKDIDWNTCVTLYADDIFMLSIHNEKNA